MTRSLVFAWLVHLYTALGVFVGFLSLLAIDQGSFRETFFLMGIAVLIDATDGTLARLARVKEVLPWFDGNLLDELVDYFNYVTVPCFFVFRANLLPATDALWLAMLPLLASAYGFSQMNAKTADNFFLGFPSYWNIVVFYLYVLQAPKWINAFVILGLCVLVFVPIKYIYPSRSPRFRFQTNLLGALWGVAIFYIVYHLPEASTRVAMVSLLFPAYYTALSLWLEFRRLLPDAPKGPNA